MPDRPVSLPLKKFFTSEHPVLIAGPCSAESEQQVHNTFELLNKYVPNLAFFRAGIWKPRTRPDSFEGLGAVALPWVVSAAKSLGKCISVEVANAEHVEQSLQAGVDILWIGARTTVNPFQVQEIADSVRGLDIPIMVKNPVNPDLELWIGALERLSKAGIERLAAVHRGFSSYEKSVYRNRPNWEIPIELRRRIPGLPVYCDPSHICGKRSLLKQVAQTAMDLHFDGLMIEVHPDPEHALSDAEQQLTPYAYSELLSFLLIREMEVEELQGHQALEELRNKIDRIDNYVIELMSERMEISSEIGRYKDLHNIAVYQPERWRLIIKRAIELGRSNGLSEGFILNLFRQVHNESIQHQFDAMRSLKEDSGS